MPALPFNDLYIGECENCGADLDDWNWLADDMVFRTACTCGAEYTLEPTVGVLSSEIDADENEEEIE